MKSDIPFHSSHPLIPFSRYSYFKSLFLNLSGYLYKTLNKNNSQVAVKTPLDIIY